MWHFTSLCRHSRRRDKGFQTDSFGWSWQLEPTLYFLVASCGFGGAWWCLYLTWMKAACWMFLEAKVWKVPEKRELEFLPTKGNRKGSRASRKLESSHLRNRCKNWNSFESYVLHFAPNFILRDVSCLKLRICFWLWLMTTGWSW